MQGMTLDKWPIQKYWSVLVAGRPKDSGKTTFAMSATKPLVLLSFDFGRVSIPPGVDTKDVLIIPYHELTRAFNPDGSSAPQIDIWIRLLKDLQAIMTSVRQGKDLVLEDGTTFPSPKTVVLDGMSRLGSMLVDGRLALNNMAYTDDLDKESRFKFWGKRLTDLYTMIQQIASLPCNIVMTAWIDPQVITVDGKPVTTGVWLADIGGKADLLTPGTVSATMVCSSRQGRFYAQIKSDAKYPWLGIRGVYTNPTEIDITIPRPDGKLPWELVFRDNKGI